MFLEYWMIAVLLVFFGIALVSLYNDGFNKGHIAGGVFTYFLLEQLCRENLPEGDPTWETIRKLISKQD